MGWYNHDGNFDGYKVDMSGPAPTKLKSYDEVCMERGWKIRDELLHLEGYTTELIENLELAKRDGVPLEKKTLIDGLTRAVRHLTKVADNFNGEVPTDHFGQVGKIGLHLMGANRKHAEVMEAVSWKNHEDVRNSKVISIPAYFSDYQLEDEMERRKTGAFLYLKEVTDREKYLHVDEDTINVINTLGRKVLDKLESDQAKLWWNAATSQWQSVKPE